MRANSQNIKNKNLIILNKKPLMFYTIKSAINSKLFANIVVSSDSRKIQKLSKKFGAEVIFSRPKKLSTNYVPKLSVIKHAVINSEKHYKKKYDYVIDLDVTAPCRDSSDIKRAFKIFQKSRKNMLVSVTKSRKNPYFNMLEIKKKGISLVKKTSKEVVARQKSPEVYDMNASIYIWKRSRLLKSSQLFSKNTNIYVMPQSRSIDIDNHFDLNLIKHIERNKNA